MGVTPETEINDKEQLTKPKLFLNQKMDSALYFDVGPVVVGFFSTPCPVSENKNEDAVCLIPISGESAIFVLADGAGGFKAGDEAAKIAVSVFKNLLSTESKISSEDLRFLILNGLEKANKEIKSLGLGAATTISIVSLEKNIIRAYHVGDSLILSMGQKGSVKFQNIPHSPTGYALEAGLMDEKEALHHEERYLVSNLLGTAETRIEMGPEVEFSPRDTVIIASDGLTDNLTSEEIIDRCRKGPIAEVMDSLQKDTLQRMKAEPGGKHPCKPDDLTIICFRSKNGNEA